MIISATAETIKDVAFFPTGLFGIGSFDDSMTGNDTDRGPAKNRVHGLPAGCAVLALVVVLLDGGSLAFGFVNWDDELYVVSNPHLLTPDRVRPIDHLLTRYLGYPIPVTIATYHLEYRLWGLNPLGYHATNLLLHVVSVCLIFCVGIRLGNGAWPSGLAAALFAVHPITAEPVAWVTGRKDLLAACFCLASLYLLLGDRSGPGARRRLTAGVLFVLSLLSKPVSALMPFAFLAADRWLRGRTVRESGTLFFSLSGVSLLVIALSASFESDMGAFRHDAPLQWLGNIATVTYLQMQHVLAPVELLPKYVFPDSRGFPWVGAAASTTTLVLLCYGIWRPPGKSRALSLSLLWIVLGYLPVSGAAPLARQVADGYLYLPLAGAAWAVSFCLNGILQRPGRVRTVWASGLLLLLIGTLVPLRRQSLSYWRDPVQLWSAVYAVYPKSPQVCRNLGNAFIWDPQLRPWSPRPVQAAQVYLHCMKTMPRHRDLFVKNLGIALYMSGRWEESRTLLRERLRSDPGDQTAKRYLRLMRPDDPDRGAK